jgi:hypothetical protein
MSSNDQIVDINEDRRLLNEPTPVFPIPVSKNYNGCGKFCTQLENAKNCRFQHYVELRALYRFANAT